MNKTLLFTALCFSLLFRREASAQEKYAYEYGHTNMSLTVDFIAAGYGREDGKIVQMLEYRPECFDQHGWHKWACGEPILSVPYEGIFRDRVSFEIPDIPAGMYTIKVKYVNGENHIWRIRGSIGRTVEIPESNSAFININQTCDCK